MGEERGATRIDSPSSAAAEDQEGRLEILIELERQAGKMRADGSIDFREINFAPSVRQGELLARYYPVASEGGARAGDRRDWPLVAGKGVRMEREGDAVLFYAEISGVARQEGKALSVVRLLQIDGNVDFNTGNLNFDGEIRIAGSVVQGFAVRATGNISVAKTIETGAQVETGGNLTVGGGIVGRRTQVRAKGTVWVQFVQEATVSAGQDILIGSFAYQARLRAGGQIKVEQGNGRHGGSLIGGQIWANRRIEARRLGAPSHVTTSLVVGMDPEKARQLDRLRETADLTYARLTQLLQRFGLTRIDVAQIRNMIAAATGPQRKVLTGRARQLAQLIQVYQRLMAARQELEQKLAIQFQEAEIRTHEKAFPGVEIRLGEHRRRLERELEAPWFRLVDGHLVDH